MPRVGNAYSASGSSIERSSARPWTKKEDADLARAFIDLDLDGAELYAWCLKHGITRSPGAIDRRLSDMNFFDTDATKMKLPEPSTVRKMTTLWPKSTEVQRKMVMLLARQSLANQIKLAKLEAATAPLYRPGDL